MVLSTKMLNKTPARSGVGTVSIGRNPLPLGMGRFNGKGLVYFANKLKTELTGV